MCTRSAQPSKYMTLIPPFIQRNPDGIVVKKVSKVIMTLGECELTVRIIIRTVAEYISL